MACFVVPMTEAVVTTVAQRIMKAHEKEEKLSPEMDCAEGVNKIPFSVKLGWLNRLLWGGSALLAFEHLWHGEIVPFFPFLTAVADGEVSGMLAKMSTTGVMMAVLVTVVWAGMLLVSSAMEKHMLHNPQTAKENG